MTKEEIINILKYELSQISDDERHPNLLQHKDFCKTVLEELEERPTGEWIWDGYQSLYCTACKEHIYCPEDPDIPAETRFCPNCGAKMKRH